MRTDELALREALADMTVGQPALPVDRAAGVRRKYARRRQLLAATGAGVLAVAVVAAVAVGGAFNGTRSAQPINRPVPSWALQWDDHRDGSVPQQVLDKALRSWEDQKLEAAPLPKSQPVQMSEPVWYVGQRVPGTDQVLAVFEAKDLHAGALPLTNGPRLVVATAPWDNVRLATEGSKAAWTFVDIAAPPHNYAGFIGSYISVPKGDAGMHNVVWLLTSPSYKWAQTSVGREDLHGGFVTFDAGQLRAQVEASFHDGTGRYPVGGFVGIPGVPSSHVPTLELPGSLTGVPQSRLTLGPTAAQGRSTEADEDAKAPAGRATTVYARCYSAGDAHGIRVSIDAATDRALAHGVRITCDGRQHVVPGHPTGKSLYGTGGHSVSVKADDLVAWTVAVVIHGQ